MAKYFYSKNSDMSCLDLYTEGKKFSNILSEFTV